MALGPCIVADCEEMYHGSITECLLFLFFSLFSYYYLWGGMISVSLSNFGGLVGLKSYKKIIIIKNEN